MNVIRVNNDEQLQAAYRIRKDVFCKEQGVPEEAELDQYDPIADHVLVYDGEQPAATGRVRIVDGIAKLERICVAATHRKRHFGEAVMNELEAIAMEKGLKNAKLHGQVQAAPFYEKMGYRTASAVFEEENIPHVVMVKELKQ